MSNENTKTSGGQPQTIGQIFLPLTAIIFGLFMVILDGTAMNVALAGLMIEFEETFSVVQWTVTGYALATAAVIPLAGWLSDRFGAKRIFLLSIGMFTAASLLCALATGVNQLIIFRIIQGLGGGMVMPIALAFTYRLSPPGKVGAVMGMMGIPILLAPALGPIVAGWLVEFASWKWIFLINLPIGLIGIAMGLRTLPNIERQSVAALDLPGMLLAPIAFAALSYGVIEGGESWTSTKTITGIVVGAIALALFIIAELRRDNPLLELRVFKSADFSKGISVQWISQIALFGTIFLVPVFLQQAKGYSPFETGLIMLPQALAAGLTMPISGKLFDKIGVRPLVMVGMTIVTAASFLLSRISADDGLIMVMLPLAMLGVGMGCFMMPLNTHLLQAAPQNLVSRVTSLTNAAQQVVNSLAIAMLTTIMASRMKSYVPPETMPTLEHYTKSFGDTFVVLVCIAVAGIVLATVLRKPKRQPDEGDKAPAGDPGMIMH